MTKTTALVILISLSTGLFNTHRRCPGSDGALPPALRRYDLGPLGVREFRGDVANFRRGTAYTATRTVLNFTCDVQTHEEEVVATLSTLTAYAAFLPNQSWWDAAASARLLDHEQGHFDNAEISVRRLRLAVARQAADGQAMAASGSSPAAAYQALVNKLSEAVRSADQQREQADREYDRLTRHGHHEQIQRERRRMQCLTLRRLNQELTEVQSRETGEPE